MEPENPRTAGAASLGQLTLEASSNRRSTVAPPIAPRCAKREGPSRDARVRSRIHLLTGAAPNAGFGGTIPFTASAGAEHRVPGSSERTPVRQIARYLQ
jgi:hypothetical protein